MRFDPHGNGSMPAYNKSPVGTDRRSSLCFSQQRDRMKTTTSRWRKHYKMRYYLNAAVGAHVETKAIQF